MLRDKNLIPLSHQHQHALALCVRLDRALQAGAVEAEVWQAEIQQIFEQEIAVHFAAEEKEVFPTAARFLELQPLIDELLAEHGVLRGLFAQTASRTLGATGLQGFADAFSRHIRREERELFESMQRLMTAEELARLGRALETALSEASGACLIPTEATRLRPKNS
jgi:hemerythrin-like domain-containing protein